MACTLILYTTGGYSQTNSMVHFSKSFYTSGEVVWYRVYLTEGFPKAAKVIAVSVYQAQRGLVDQFHLLSDSTSATASGYYRIPHDCSSGVYEFVFTAFEKGTNFPVTLAEASVPIYNDLQGNTATSAAESPSSAALGTPKPSGDLKILIKTNASSYSPREKAAVMIEVRDESGAPVEAQLSIAIRDERLTTINHPLFSTLKTGKEPSLDKELANEIPISGTFKGPEGEDLVKKGNMGVYMITQRQFTYFQSKSNGDYSFEVPNTYGPFSLHFRSFLPANLQTRVDRDVPHRKLKTELPMLPEIAEYLRLSKKRKSIFHLFGMTENAFEVEDKVVQEQTLEYDASYWIDEYEPFPDIKTFSKELFLPLRIRQDKDGNYLVRVFNPAQNVRRYYSKPPIFLIDGKLTGNENIFANLELSEIENLHLVWDFPKLKAYFGPLGYRGAIIVETKNGNFELPEEDLAGLFDFNGIQPPANYPIQPGEASKISIHPTLFWAPNVQTNSSGTTTLSVPLSDDQSRFVIEVMAQDHNGNQGAGYQTFEVALKQ